MARSTPIGPVARAQHGLVAAASEVGQADAGQPVAVVRTIPSLARRLAKRAHSGTGLRTLVVGEAAGAPVGGVAIELARQLALLERQVILLDWSLDGVGMAAELGVSPTLGITDVLSGRASFEDVIARLGGSAAHAIAAGSSVAGTAAAGDKDRVDMLLDALDDAYDHVLITGKQDAVRDLFTTIEGRIDVGIVIADGENPVGAGSFLGFNVVGLEVIRYEAAVHELGETSMPVHRGALV
jgi:Mrp family chromosome partitioning ATPase